MSRRSLVLGLATSAAAPPLVAACTLGQQEGGAGAPSSKTIAPAKLVWAYWGGTLEAGLRSDVMADVERTYPSITIDRMHNTGGLDDHFAKVQVLVSSGSGLDLFMSSPIWLPNLAVRALYQPLDQLMARDKFPKQDWSPAALSAFAFRGKQYALTEALNFAVIVYNKDVFAQMGVPLPPADWTWDQFLDLARRLTVRSGAEITRWGIGPVSTDLNNTLPWIWSNGGRIFDDEEDPKRSTFSTPANVEAVQWRADWAHRHGVAPKAGEITQPGDAFTNGFLAMSVTTIVGFTSLARNITTFTWDVLQIPRGKGGRFNFTGAAAHGLATGTKHPEQAWLALQHQTGRPGQTMYMRGGYGIPPLLSLARQEYPQVGPPPANRRAVVDALATLRPLPKVPAMLELYNQVYGAELTNIYAGRRTARDAAPEIDRQVQLKLEGK